MRFRPTLLALVVLAVAVCPLLLCGAKYRRAARGAEDAAVSLIETAGQVDRVVALRQREERVSEQKRPEQDVIARVNAVLDEVGVERSSFAGVRPDGDAPVADAGEADGPSYRQQSVRLTLRDITVEQIGAFLARWTETQALWVPSRIELTHSRARVVGQVYDVTIVVAAMYVAS